jgi:hypothetical protein
VWHLNDDTTGVSYSLTSPVSDVAGNDLTTGLDQAVKNDATAPEVAFDCSTDNGLNYGPCSSGWYIGEVWIRASVTDATSGLDVPLTATGGADATESTCDDVSDGALSCVLVWKLTTDTAGTSFSVSPTDLAGNSATPDVPTILLDETPPTVTWECSTTSATTGYGACSSGWYTAADVWVQATVSDATSGLDDSINTSASATDLDGTTSTCDDAADGDSDCVFVWHLNDDTTGVSYSLTSPVSDVAGNDLTTGLEQSVMNDATPPTVAWLCSTDDGANYVACSSGWYTTDVWVQATIADATSGLAYVSVSPGGYDLGEGTCDDASAGDLECTVVWKLTTDTTGTTFAVLAGTADVAGNDLGADDSVAIKRDATGPSVAITAPTDGTTYLPSQYLALCTASPSAEICGTASDATSGLASIESQIKWNNGTEDRYFDGSDFDSNVSTWNNVGNTSPWSLGFNPATATGEGTGANWIGYVSENFYAEARATDNATNSTTTGTTTFTVAKAASSVLPISDPYDIDDGTTTTITAQVSSSASQCISGRTVQFWVDLNGDASFGAGEMVGTALTNGSGVATLTFAIAHGVYDVRLVVTESLDCLATSTEFGLAVVGPGETASGGGWYHFRQGGTPRVNFGFTVKKDCGIPGRPTCPSDPTLIPYKGQFLAINTARWRVKGDLNSFGTASCPSSLLTANPSLLCGSARGSGKLYWWDQTLNAGLGDWVLKANVTYTFTFYDGGAGRNGANNPDYAGLVIVAYTPLSSEGTLPNSTPQNMRGGNVKIGDTASSSKKRPKTA